ncbi:hypothetical protein GF312_08605 [Candidatus Poribacteria bacterium]|nr:hypothetical protein [Candidatus Poribacteria bacterium]
MTWKNLRGIDSISMDDMDEYHSRPDNRIMEYIDHISGDIVIYGARGKFSRHLSLMLLRAIQETGKACVKVHLVSSSRIDERFDQLVKPYEDIVIQHHMNLVEVSESDLKTIPPQPQLMFYMAGYKFAKPDEGDEEYELMCNLYGMVIPSTVFGYHQEGTQMVVMGSYNGIELTPVDALARDNAPIKPSSGNYYGQSILNKELVIKAILKGRNLNNPSKAVILRGGYYTDSATYGGLEPEILKIIKGEVIDLSQKAYFNLLSHRDTAIATILAPELIDNRVSCYNLTGHLVDVKKSTMQIVKELREYPVYSEVTVSFTGKPADVHLIADGSALQSKLGRPIDSLEDIIHAHVYWLVNGGKTRGLDHKIGKIM